MRLRRQAAAIVLVLTCATPWAAAADPALKSRNRSEHSILNVSAILGHAWNLFTSLWGAASDSDEGHGMDPLGGPTQPFTDEGPGMDPLGSPPQPTTDAGSGMDPLG